MLCMNCTASSICRLIPEGWKELLTFPYATYASTHYPELGTHHALEVLRYRCCMSIEDSQTLRLK